jgi:transposase-like protein
MSVNRWRFTREFKLAALQRLESGASAAEVALAFDANPNVWPTGVCELDAK